MKAFIVLALVSCVAARSLDIDTIRLLSKEKSHDLLLKDRLLSNTHRFSPLSRKTLLNSFDYTPSTYTYGDDVESSWAQRQVTLLDIEELVSHPLFREYLSIPLFRQFWEQYPTVFRRYVESPLFQQFWTVPQFMQYFRNPIFFYKYIVPQVQVIAQSVPYTTEGIYNKYPSTSYNYDVQGYYPRNHVTVEEYLNKIFGHGIERSVVSPYSGYPYVSDYSDRYTTPFFGGRFNHYGQGLNAVSHKFLLDKIYKTLFVNKPTVGEVTQVRTDVKIAPAHKEVVVEPVTGESKVVYEPTKIVDVKVDEKIVPRSEINTVSPYDVERDVVVKDALLKRFLVNKHISVELYTVLKTLPLHQVREILRRIVPSVDVETIFGDDYTYPTRHHAYTGVEDVNNVDINDVLYRHKINEIVGQLYNKEFVGDRYTHVARDLLKVLGHHNYVRDVLPIDEIVRA
jgi:hypothetical protein